MNTNRIMIPLDDGGASHTVKLETAKNGVVRGITANKLSYDASAGSIYIQFSFFYSTGSSATRPQVRHLRLIREVLVGYAGLGQ